MDDDDPLARFRRLRDEPLPTRPKPDTSRVYVAFDAQDKLISLDIRRTSGASHAPGYGYLLDIIYGARFYTRFVLVFNFMTVTCKGKHLREVVQALKLRKCSYLQEFHPKLFDVPEDGKPIITSIEVVTGERAAAMNEADLESGEPPA